ncbi:MAG: hypothetical protein ACR2PL_03710 [Dehalococcoidia bacterium]
MNLSLVEQIANAVLYEGYMLYPYRPSSVKNRQRWTFGGVCPQSYSEAQHGSESWTVQAECLVLANPGTRLTVKTRFLHLLLREVGAVEDSRRAAVGSRQSAVGAGDQDATLSRSDVPSRSTTEDDALLGTSRRFASGDASHPTADCPQPTAASGSLPTAARSSDTHYTVVESLAVDGQIYHTWEEAVERDVTVTHLSPADLAREPHRLSFAFAASRTLEPLRNAMGEPVAVLVRSQQPIEGILEISVRSGEAPSAGEDADRYGTQPLAGVDLPVGPEPLDMDVRPPSLAQSVRSTACTLTVRVKNCTPFQDAAARSRAEAMLQSLVSTHLILSLQDGAFGSSLDPPEAFRQQGAACHNRGLWPVLVGEEGERDAMLASPIILYDYPQIAPESPGDLFDGTEIDEILTLRIMTMTDAEKREMRGVDERARALLDRTEALPSAAFAKLHGAMRSPRRAIGEPEVRS